MSTLNGTMLQAFHWYSVADGSLWRTLQQRAGELRQAGFTSVWMPPAYKGTGGARDVGYGVYDMYDLGEFNQKGSVRTRYGTREEYLGALAALHGAGLRAYADIVLNHRMGGDETEVVQATPLGMDDRTRPTGPMRAIRAYTRFTFPGRQGKYSGFQYRASHFDAVDHDADRSDDRAVYLLEGKHFDDQVDLEKGNFDYLMGCDLDFGSEEVVAEQINWGKWYLDTTGVEGLRLDAVKHIHAPFFATWLAAMRQHAGRELSVFGEYWSGNLAALEWYLDTVGGAMSLFDVPLHFNFHQASRSGADYDLRHLLDGSLVQKRPAQAVTFVSNHDSQALQALESVVESWFVPLAYALILLRKDGYPCVFVADYDGAEYEDRGKDGQHHRIVMPSHRILIDRFLDARRNFAYGPQRDYFDDPQRIGWVRSGDEQHPRAMAVLLSNGPEGSKWMDVGRPNTRFHDVTGHVEQPVTTNAEGHGEFRCPGGSVSVWVQEPSGQMT